jgi:hypothetical protein
MMPQVIGRLAEGVGKAAIEKRREEEEECEGEGGGVLTPSSSPRGPPVMLETERIDSLRTSRSHVSLGPMVPGPRWPSQIPLAFQPRLQLKTKTARSGSRARTN